MLAATVAVVGVALAAGAAAVHEGPATESLAVASVDTERLLDALGLAPIREGVRAPGPTRFGNHYWIDKAVGENPLAIEYLILAVLPSAEAAQAHFDRLRQGGRSTLIERADSSEDRLAMRFEYTLDPTNVTLTQGNVFAAFRGTGTRADLLQFAEELEQALADEAIAEPGTPEPTPDAELILEALRPYLAVLRVLWALPSDDDGGAPMEEGVPFVLYRPTGEYIGMSSPGDACELGRVDYDSLAGGTVEVVAGWPDNRWGRWLTEMPTPEAAARP